MFFKANKNITHLLAPAKPFIVWSKTTVNFIVVFDQTIKVNAVFIDHLSSDKLIAIQLILNDKVNIRQTIDFQLDEEVKDLGRFRHD